MIMVMYVPPFQSIHGLAAAQEQGHAFPVRAATMIYSAATLTSIAFLAAWILLGPTKEMCRS